LSGKPARFDNFIAHYDQAAKPFKRTYMADPSSA
jgi:hypothetical protein